MNKKVIVATIIGVIIISIVLGFLVNVQRTPLPSSTNTVLPEPSPTSILNTNVTTIQIQTTPTKVPTPTFLPLSEVVKSIDDQKIVVEGKGGEMIVPKNTSIVKVFKRVGGKLLPATFVEVKVGQQVTLKIITPGKEAELIIEP